MFPRNIAAKFCLFLSFLFHINADGTISGKERAMDVSPYSYPYMVAIIRDNDIDDRCAGALITTDFILTAAQCADEVLVEVFLGAYDITMPDIETHRTVIDHQDIFLHPYYHRDTLSYNVALLKLPENTVLPDRVKPVEVANSSSNLFVNEKAVLTGWGRKQLFGPSTTHMSALSVKVISNNKCRRYYKNLQRNQMCAQEEKKRIFTLFHSASTLRDVMGNALVIPNQHILIGLVSMRTRSSLIRREPIIFIRVSDYKEWIDTVVALMTTTTTTTAPSMTSESVDQTEENSEKTSTISSDATDQIMEQISTTEKPWILFSN